MKRIDNYNPIITRTIYMYYLERTREFRYLIYQYKKCTDLYERRSIRKRKEELISILNNAVCINKAKLIPMLGINYVDIKDYPQLIEIKRKQEYLKRIIA